MAEGSVCRGAWCMCSIGWTLHASSLFLITQAHRFRRLAPASEPWAEREQHDLQVKLRVGLRNPTAKWTSDPNRNVSPAQASCRLADISQSSCSAFSQSSKQSLFKTAADSKSTMLVQTKCWGKCAEGMVATAITRNGWTPQEDSLQCN